MPKSGPQKSNKTPAYRQRSGYNDAIVTLTDAVNLRYVDVPEGRSSRGEGGGEGFEGLLGIGPVCDLPRVLHHVDLRDLEADWCARSRAVSVPMSRR